MANQQHFIYAQRISNQLARLFCGSFYFLMTAFYCQPLVVMAYHKWNGTFRPEMVRLGYDVITPFSLSTVHGYLMGLAFEFLCTSYMGVLMLGSDALFIGGCLFAMAYLGDLNDSIGALDAEFCRTGDCNALRKNLLKAVQKQLHFYQSVDLYTYLSSSCSRR